MPCRTHHLRHGGFAAAFLALAAFAVPGTALGLTALKNGKTSTKPTSSDPALFKCQLSTDPLGVTEFQITQQFDPARVNLALFLQTPAVRAVNGYALGLPGASETEPTYRIQITRSATDQPIGLITVRGYWPGTLATLPKEEIDVFIVDYPFLPGPLDPREFPVSFSTIGLPAAQSLYGPNSPDFIRTAQFDDNGQFTGIDVFKNDGGTEKQIDPSTAVFTLISPYLSIIGESAGTAPSRPIEVVVPLTGGQLVPTYVTVDPARALKGQYLFDFGPDAPGSIIVGLDFSGTPEAIAAAIAQLGLSPLGPGNPFGDGFDATYRVPAGNAEFYTLDYQLTQLQNVTLTRFAFVPEPGVAALLVPTIVAMGAFRPRRR